MTMSKAVFWDLQGTLGGEATGRIEEFEPFPFAKEALETTKRAGFLNIIVTNQSRIGKGELSPEIYAAHENRIRTLFGPFIDDLLVCPHTNAEGCVCKKPKTGLVDLCVEKYGLDVQKCFVVGDMGKNEIVLAHNARCKGVLVLTGGGRASLAQFRHTWAGHEADIIAENALDAAEKIIR